MTAAAGQCFECNQQCEMIVVSTQCTPRGGRLSSRDAIQANYANMQ